MPEKQESEVRTLDQRRASDAWKVVQDVKAGNDEKKKKEFGTQAKKLPMRIMAAGLGHALAFLEGKGYAESLRSALNEWARKRREPEQGEDARLFVRIIQKDADFQRWATAECLAYLRWLVRFADAEDLTRGTQE